MSRPSWELEHRYGDKVHILDDLVAATLLTRLSQPQTRQPEFNQICAELYKRLAAAVFHQRLPSKVVEVETAMAASEGKRGRLTAEVIDPHTELVTVSIARAGILPSSLCYDMACAVLEPSNVRQDHVMMERITNERGEVTGSQLLGGKIGGSVSGAIVLLPDPMGATGRSIVGVKDHYKKHGGDEARAWIALNLIITPEYIRYVAENAPDMEIFALRVDRGASPDDVLATVPGTHAERESGLSEIDFILPGAGGVGERMNNTES